MKPDLLLRNTQTVEVTTLCLSFFYTLQPLTGSALASLVKGLPEALQRQYEYEDPIVRSGKHLMHSPFFKVRLCCTAEMSAQTSNLMLQVRSSTQLAYKTEDRNYQSEIVL